MGVFKIDDIKGWVEDPARADMRAASSTLGISSATQTVLQSIRPGDQTSHTLIQNTLYL